MGDSVCLAVKDSGSDPTFMQVGLKRQCANGVKLTDVSYIPSDYDLIFLHYGANDIKGITTAEQFRNQLLYLLPTTSAKVYCVLPVTSAKLASGDAFRQVMFDECTYTLDPTDFGVTAGKDGIHWLSEGHNKFTPAVQGVLDFEGITPLPEPVLYQP